MSKTTHPKTLNKHRVKALDFAYDNGSNGKAPQVIVRLQIVEGQFLGSIRTYYGSLHEKCQDWTVKALRALGMTNDDITAPVGLGSRVALAVERENLFPGAKHKSRIDFIDPIEAPKLKANNPIVSTAEAKQVASRFKALFKAQPALELSDAVKAPANIPVKDAFEAEAAEPETNPAPF